MARRIVLRLMHWSDTSAPVTQLRSLVWQQPCALRQQDQSGELIEEAMTSWPRWGVARRLWLQQRHGELQSP